MDQPPRTEGESRSVITEPGCLIQVDRFRNRAPVLRIVNKLVNPHHIRVINVRLYAEFSEESLLLFRTHTHVGSEDLHRNEQPNTVYTMSLIDLSDPPTPEGACYFEAVDPSACL